MNVTGIILAGGQSSRMGVNKAVLDVGGITVIEKIISELSPVVSRIVIATNDKNPYPSLGLEIVHDNYPCQGPLAGLQVGLSTADTPWCIITACDVPWITSGVFETLLHVIHKCEADRPGEVQAIVPISRSIPQPLVAAYHQSVLPLVNITLASEQWSMMSLLKQLQVHYIEESYMNQHSGVTTEIALFNMNTPADYRRVCDDKSYGKRLQKKL